MISAANKQLSVKHKSVRPSSTMRRAIITDFSLFICLYFFLVYIFILIMFNNKRAFSHRKKLIAAYDEQISSIEWTACTRACVSERDKETIGVQITWMHLRFGSAFSSTLLHCIA